MKLIRKSMLVFGLLITFIFDVSARADQPPVVAVTLDIHPQSLSDALSTFGAQSGLQVVFLADVGKGLSAPRLAGRFSPEAALDRLLANTALSYRFLNSRTVEILSRSPTSSDFRAPSRPGSEEGAFVGGKDEVRLAQAADASDASTASPSQTEGGLPDESQNIPEILVKGSHILNVDVRRTQDDVQPYVVMDSKMIQQSGAANVEEFLKQRLTMNTTIVSNSQQWGGGVTNTSSINLRGLGTNETLILIDGRRSAGTAAAGADFGAQPDINGIPLAAIERIEVLPSGASAIYGGAALGGVVNVILKKNYTGGEISYSYDNVTSGSAPIAQVDATYGFSLWGGKTSVMVAGHYGDSVALVGMDRQSLVQRGVSTILKNSPSYLYSVSSPFHGATTNVSSADGSDLTFKGGASLDSPISYVSAGTSTPAELNAGLVANAGTYNLNPDTGDGMYGSRATLGVAPRTKSFLLNARQEMASWLEGFAGFSTSSNANTSIANAIDSFAYPVPVAAPTNPFAQDVNVTFPSTLGKAAYTNNLTQGVNVGLVARLPRGWNSEIDYTWSGSALSYRDPGIDYTKILVDLASGALNPFQNTTNLDLTPYTPLTTYSGHTSLNDLGLRLSGPISMLSWLTPVLTIGLEHRKEGSRDSNQFNYHSDPAENYVGRYFGQTQSTNSLYAEAHLPLVNSSNALTLVHSLELQLAGRSERYTVDVGTPAAYIVGGVVQDYSPTQGERATIRYTSTNPTFGIKYEPIAGLAFRGSYAKAFLPPSAAQLLPSSAVTYTGQITDPVNGQTYTVGLINGGNPNLSPQTSRDTLLGVIFEPQQEWGKGLRIDLEHYRTVQPNYIVSPSAAAILDGPSFANRITRDPVTGLITTLDLSYVNATQYETAGWDLSIDYRRPTALGTFNLRAAATAISYDRRQYSIGSEFADYVGYPSETGEAKRKANLSLSFEHQSITFVWSAIYFGNYKQYLSNGSPLDVQLGLHGSYTYYTAAQGGDTIPSQLYHNFLASYSFGSHITGSSRLQSILSGSTLQLGIKNVFNKLPPFDAFYSPYYYSPYGDPRLRSYEITLKKGF